MSSNITNNLSPAKKGLDAPVDPYVAKRPRTGDAYTSSLQQSTLDADFDFISTPFDTQFENFDALFGSTSLPLDYSASLAEDRPPSSSSLSSASTPSHRDCFSPPPVVSSRPSTPLYSIAEQEWLMKHVIDKMKTFNVKDLSTIKHEILTVVDALSPQNKGKLYLSFGNALFKSYKREVNPAIVPEFFECIGKVYTVAAQSADLGLERDAAQLQLDFNSLTARQFSSSSSSSSLEEPLGPIRRASQPSSSTPVYSITDQNYALKCVTDGLKSFKANDLTTAKNSIETIVDVLSPQAKVRLYLSFGQVLLKSYKKEKVPAITPELFECIAKAFASVTPSTDPTLIAAVSKLQSDSLITIQCFSSSSSAALSQPVRSQLPSTATETTPLRIPRPLPKPVASTKKSDTVPKKIVAEISVSAHGVEAPLELYDIPFSMIWPLTGELLQSKIDKIKKLQPLIFDSPLKKEKIALVDDLLQEPRNPYFSLPPAIKALLRCKYAIALMKIYRQDRSPVIHKKMVDNYLLAIQYSCAAKDLTTSALAFYNFGVILEMTKETENLASAKDLYSSALQLKFSNPALRADLELALARVDKTPSSK